jgi:hypothetical protein
MNVPIFGQPITIEYVAWNTSSSTYQTGDAANHTLRGVGDGSEFTPAATPAQVDAVKLPGLYKVAIAGAENSYNVVTVGGISTTANVVLIPTQWSNIASGTQIIIVSPVNTDGAVLIQAGYDYFAADSRSLLWTDTGSFWPNLTGATLTLALASALSGPFTPVCLNPGALQQQIQLELSAVQTTGMKGTQYLISAVLSDAHNVPLVIGPWRVNP